MRTLGLIGGMSWVSTHTYYRRLNEGVAKRLGAHQSSSLLLRSLNFADVEKLQRANDWAQLDEIMHAAAQSLQAGGAQAIVICANTMHKAVGAVRETGLPVLHIADAIAAVCGERGLRRVGLLGTRFTMAEPFLADVLGKHGLEVTSPSAPDQETIHRIIYEELVHNRISDKGRHEGLAVIRRLEDEGCDCAALACTELGIPAWDTDTQLPLIDSLEAHVEYALDWQLSAES